MIVNMKRFFYTKPQHGIKLCTFFENILKANIWDLPLRLNPTTSDTNSSESAIESSSFSTRKYSKLISSRELFLPRIEIRAHR